MTSAPSPLEFRIRTSWWRRAFARRRAPLVVVLLSLAALSPSLGTDLSADDHYHRLIAQGTWSLAPAHPRPLDLFTFFDGQPETVARRVGAGMMPWWSHPNVRLAFFRPLTAVTHTVDERLWPGAPWLMHAHSLLWFALGLWAAWRVFVRFLGEGAAPAIALRIAPVLALALFALDDARGPTVGWIANRSALVSLALSLPALLLHDHWRRGPGGGLSNARLAGLAAPLVLGVGLLGAEAAMGTFAYLVAYALVLDREGPLRGLVHLVPSGVVVLAWMVGYRALGYGAAHSGVYFDPGVDRALFLGGLVERMPTLLAGQLALPWSDGHALATLLGGGARGGAVFAAVCATVVAAVAWLLVPLLRRDRVARFFALGMVGALVPVCAAFPADRLLTFSGIGAAGLLARLFLDDDRLDAVLGKVTPWSARVRRGGGITLAVVHLLLGPLLLPARSLSMDTVERALANADAGIPRDPSIAQKTVVLLDSPGDMLLAYLPIERDSRGVPRPARMSWLSAGASTVTVRRPEERVLEVSMAGGFLSQITERMARGPRDRFVEGQGIAIGDWARATVIRVTDDGRPETVRFAFTRPIALEDPEYVWLRWGARTFEPARPPPVGGAITLPAIDLLRALGPAK